jgi:ureidoglycolate dehydrogenase (NAD+)
MREEFYYNPTKLHEWMIHILVEKKISQDVATHVASSTIETSLRGVDSHGINLFPHYARIATSGRINSEAKVTEKLVAPSLAVVDADWTYGHYAGSIGIRRAMSVAEQQGIGLVHIQNSSHFGAAAYFALQAARQNMLGLAFTNADSLVKAANSTKSFFGTNPICIAAPLIGEEPLCLDMATSSIPWNKVKNYRSEDKQLPSGVAYDSEGIETTNPHEASMLAPTGTYKGFALGMFVDVLVSTLIGQPIGASLKPMYADLAQKRPVSHLFAAINIASYQSVDGFKSELLNIVKQIRNLPCENVTIPVMVPGDPEKSEYSKRIKTGIPVTQEYHQLFLQISSSIKSVIV